jgi:hypothetical protein
MKFGWLKDKSVIETSFVEIAPLADFDNAISEVINSSQHDGTWYYPPIDYKTDSFSPKVVASRFELPPTHCIKQKNGSQDLELLNYLVVFYGWLHGLRLNPEGWGYLIKTPIKQGKLVDFIKPSSSELRNLIQKAEVFWKENCEDMVYKNENVNLANLMMGALNWFSYTQCYGQIFERLMGQYTVFDTLYRIVACQNLLKNDVGHIDRFCYVSEKLELVCPSWINEISGIRNTLIHESKFAEQPIGFAANSTQGDILLGLIAFNCRAIAALLGAKGNYTRSSCETQQLHGFDIDIPRTRD